MHGNAIGHLLRQSMERMHCLRIMQGTVSIADPSTPCIGMQFNASIADGYCNRPHPLPIDRPHPLPMPIPLTHRIRSLKFSTSLQVIQLLSKSRFFSPFFLAVSQTQNSFAVNCTQIFFDMTKLKIVSAVIPKIFASIPKYLRARKSVGCDAIAYGDGVEYYNASRMPTPLPLPIDPLPSPTPLPMSMQSNIAMMSGIAIGSIHCNCLCRRHCPCR